MAPVPFEKHGIQYVVHVADSWLPYDETIELIIIIIAFFSFFFQCDMSTECKCYRLELRSKTARLLSRCVSVRAPSWIETVNVGSYIQNLTPRDLISPGRGPHPGASCCCRPCSSTQGISAVSPPRSTGGGRRL